MNVPIEALHACRANFGSYSERNLATKQQAAMLVGLGREILFVLKLVMVSVMVLCVVCVFNDEDLKWC